MKNIKPFLTALIALTLFSCDNTKQNSYPTEENINIKLISRPDSSEKSIPDDLHQEITRHSKDGNSEALIELLQFFENQQPRHPYTSNGIALILSRLFQNVSFVKELDSSNLERYIKANHSCNVPQINVIGIALQHPLVNSEVKDIAKKSIKKIEDWHADKGLAVEYMYNIEKSAMEYYNVSKTILSSDI